MLDLLHHAINLLKDSVWVGIVVAVAILIPVLGLLARTITGSRTSDLTRDETRLLKAFNEQAKGNPRAYPSVEFAAYKAEVDGYEVKLRRLKDLGYRLVEKHYEVRLEGGFGKRLPKPRHYFMPR
jgi:hypothetical protein